MDRGGSFGSGRHVHSSHYLQERIATLYEMRTNAPRGRLTGSVVPTPGADWRMRLDVDFGWREAQGRACGGRTLWRALTLSILLIHRNSSRRRSRTAEPSKMTADRPE